MQVKRKVFPYPILNKNKNLSNYNNCNFELCYTLQENPIDNSIVFKDIRYECDSEEILKLIDSNKINVVCIVECSNTIIRESKVLGNKLGEDLILYKNDFSGKIEISVFAYSENNSILLTSKEFEEDYIGLEFELDKYDIVAVDDGINFTIDHEEKQDSLAKSIFSINPMEGMTGDNFEVDINRHKIDINMSPELHKLYVKIYKNPTFKEVFFSSLLVPALVQALTECKDKIRNGNSISDVEDDFIWFKSITENYKRLKGSELDIEYFNSNSMILLSQELLGSPIKKSFESIKNVSVSNSTKGEEIDE